MVAARSYPCAVAELIVALLSSGGDGRELVIVWLRGPPKTSRYAASLAAVEAVPYCGSPLLTLRAPAAVGPLVYWRFVGGGYPWDIVVVEEQDAAREASVCSEPCVC